MYLSLETIRVNSGPGLSVFVGKKRCCVFSILLVIFITLNIFFWGYRIAQIVLISVTLDSFQISQMSQMCFFPLKPVFFRPVWTHPSRSQRHILKQNKAHLGSPKAKDVEAGILLVHSGVIKRGKLGNL